MIDLNKDVLVKLIQILKKHIPLAEIRVFGSRISGSAKSYSDLDLAIINTEKLNLKTLTALKTDLQESDIPIRIDLVDYLGIDDEFREVINQNYVVLPLV